jgi:predicted transcriptional regulator
VEVHFSSETEARLEQAARRSGKQPLQIIEEAVQRMLDYESHFVAAGLRGRLPPAEVSSSSTRK